MTRPHRPTIRARTSRTPLAWHLRRLRLRLVDLQRITGENYRSIQNWHTGRRPTPRAVLRLLAAWRLLHWRGEHDRP